jgi:RimJ/RimL family protein N-acetyltransferase
MTWTVRRGAPEDLPWLIDQLKEFSQFYGTKKPLLKDEDYARSSMLTLIENHFVRIAEKDGVLVGFIVGLFAPHPFNPEIKTLTEQFWWVSEEYRGTRAGLLLLEAYMAWGQENADWVVFTLESKSPVREQTLINRGFQLYERSYLLEVS